MSNPNAPYYPIIYVRGYAMSRDEIDTTTADPFNGFNIGSTVYRAVTDKDNPKKFFFQSPVVRLASDFEYDNVYHDGFDILDQGWEFDVDGNETKNKLTSRSIIIHRYYDIASRLLGTGKTPSIKDFAERLGDLILRVKALVCKNPENEVTEDNFRCYLVAHSMGGLVCRTLLQNSQIKTHDATKYVDKFFTYATPHNGIELGGINVPSWLTASDASNFNRETMAKYLDLEKSEGGRVDWLPENCFPSEKVFCMVGTNRMDYDVGMGLSRAFAGNGSDGLVRIENATLRELKANGQPGEPCAKAFAFRAHSGFFGIVNSEEAYQNLTRFLFGNIRVDLWLDISGIRLPPKVEQAQKKKKGIDALYQFEVMASPLGKPWYLTRRTAEEDSVACITQKEWDESKTAKIHLSTAFLADFGKIDKQSNSLSYSLKLGIRVPDYEIDNILWLDEHIEGSELFGGMLKVEITPPDGAVNLWQVTSTWQNMKVKPQIDSIDIAKLSNGSLPIEIALPTNQTSKPGITGKLRMVITDWNPGAERRSKYPQAVMA